MKKDKLPLIGVFGWKVGENSYGSSGSYVQYAQHFGQSRVITPDEPIDERLDLVIMPGGADINPVRYGSIPHMFTGKPDPMKEYFDIYILPKYIAIGTPILGICRGCQAIGVHFGGRLVQHMAHETNGDERDRMVHDVELPDTTFKREFEAVHGHAKIKVNSYHHQCISFYDLPESLEVIGVYKGKQTHKSSIEVIRHRELPIYGVQYHPEDLVTDPLGDYIVEYLISKSKNYGRIYEEPKKAVQV